jgi:hypothetical protein
MLKCAYFKNPNRTAWSTQVKTRKQREDHPKSALLLLCPTETTCAAFLRVAKVKHPSLGDHPEFEALSEADTATGYAIVTHAEQQKQQASPSPTKGGASSPSPKKLTRGKDEVEDEEEASPPPAKKLKQHDGAGATPVAQPPRSSAAASSSTSRQCPICHKRLLNVAQLCKKCCDTR